jgi:hypothetical protein
MFIHDDPAIAMRGSAAMRYVEKARLVLAELGKEATCLPRS